MAVASLFASCSDEEGNTNATTVEFASSSVELNENGETLQIPVKVKGCAQRQSNFQYRYSRDGRNSRKGRGELLYHNKELQCGRYEGC